MKIKFRMPTLGPREERERERTNAEAARNAANIDYVAMMCDVDMPNDEEGVDNDGALA